MIKIKEFKQWLNENTSYTDRVVRDMASRASRADRILTFNSNVSYQDELEKCVEYKAVDVSCRSQMKKAVKLYMEFMKSSIEV